MLRESGAAAAEYDATYVGNLPAHDTTGRLDEWFEDNFTALPTHVRVHAPGVREGTAPTCMLGFMVLQDSNTGELLGDEHDPFLMDWRPHPIWEGQGEGAAHGRRRRRWR